MLPIIDRALLDRGPEVGRKFSLFLDVLRWAPLVRYGATFPSSGRSSRTECCAGSRARR